jgi:hypothetical protein
LDGGLEAQEKMRKDKIRVKKTVPALLKLLFTFPPLSEKSPPKPF